MAIALSKLFLFLQPGDGRDHIEVCPEGGAIVQEIANRILEHGGLSLIVDYGHDGTKMETLRVCFPFRYLDKYSVTALRVFQE